MKPKSTANPWKLRPGDLPPRLAIRAEPRFRELGENAVFRYILLRRRRAGRASADGLGYQSVRAAVVSTLGPLLIGGASILGYALLLLLCVMIFRGLAIFISGFAATTTRGDPLRIFIWFCVLLVAISLAFSAGRFLCRWVPRMLAATRGELAADEARRLARNQDSDVIADLGPLPGPVLRELNLTLLTLEDIALGLWGGAVTRRSVRMRLAILGSVALLTGAVTLGLASSAPLARSPWPMILGPILLFAITERMALERAAAYTELAALAERVASILRQRDGTSLMTLLRADLRRPALRVGGVALLLAAVQFVGAPPAISFLVACGLGVFLGWIRASALTVDSHGHFMDLRRDLRELLQRPRSDIVVPWGGSVV